MARALIVGCGTRGRALGAALAAGGWQVRGTTRDEARLAPIEAMGIEGAVADPLAIGTVFDLIEGVAVIYWLLGSATGGPEDVAAINGPRLESLLAKLVDTPVRGFVLEAAGTADPEHLAEAVRVAREAAERWRIPVRAVEADPAEPDGWLAEMLAAGGRALLER